MNIYSGLLKLTQVVCNCTNVEDIFANFNVLLRI